MKTKNKIRLRVPGLVILVSAMMLFATSANANSYGSYLGTFAGNDSASSLFANIGVDADRIARVDLPAINDDGLSILGTIFNDDNEITSGEWTYSGSVIITHLVIKAGNEYAVYLFTDGLNAGLFDTSQTGGRGVSHITAYAAGPVPIPGAIWLFGTGLLAIFGMKRR